MLAFPAVAYAAAPTTTTNPATGITTSSAVLNGAGDPNSEATNGWFRYSATNPVTCDDTFGTRVPSASGTDLGTGTLAVPYSITTTGLTPGVTYYFCSIVQNASGTAFGAVLSFTIPAAPVTLTIGAISVTSSGATLQGSANPVASATTGWFRYATVDPGTCNDSFGLRAPTSGGSSLGMGTSSVDYNRGIAGLLPGTTYYYCAVAQNAFGTTFGAVLFFTTPATAPTVTTGSATGVTTSAAVLNATGVPRGDTTIGWFRYATVNPGTCTDTFGTRLPAAGGTALGADNSTVPFSQPLSGLTLGTTYYFCAIASNGIGTTVGAVTQFTTSANPPTVITGAASLVTGTTATLNGTATPNGLATTAWFRYATVNPGTCNDSFGNRAPLSSANDTALGAGLSAVNFSRTISSLTPTTTYYYCALANNGLGTSFGAVLSFVTPAMIPSVTTSATTVTSGTAATFNGTANPNGAAATGWFRYATANPGTCNDTFGTRAPTSGGAALGGGLTAVMYAEPVTGLTPLTQYFVCAIASNGQGTGVGVVQSFVTPAAPVVTTTAAINLASTSATLTGNANPNRATTTGWFRYSTSDPGTCNDSFGSRAPVSGGSSLGAGASAQNYQQTVSSLSPGTTYYFCAIASNSEGLASGTVLSFTTPAAPTVVTTAPTLVLPSTATLNGTINPNGAASTAWFRYATASPGTCNDSFGVATSTVAIVAGSAAVPFSRPITSLTPNTTYYVCAIANNSFGTSVGAVVSFATPPAAPVVTTNAASMLMVGTAQLNGTANPGGDATTAWFRYSTSSPGTCNDSFGIRAPASGGSALGAGTTTVTYAQSIAGLAPATTYYVCAIASNGVGTVVGALVTFITPAPPVVTTVAATSIGNTSATLNGTANPNRATTTGWFRYSSTDPGTCNDTFGSRAPTSGGTNLGAGSSATAYAQSIGGLSSGTTYYVCAIASNSEGLAFGTVVPFTTAGAPTVVTLAPNPVTATAATLNGTANPNGAATTGWYRYSTTNPGTCNDTFGTLTSSTSLGAGSVASPFARGISGLIPATTYYVCAIANNSFGTGFGGVVTFMTPATAPTVTTSAVAPFTGTTAQLNGSANPGGDATTGWFRYGTVSPGTCNDSFGIRAPASGGSALGAGTSAVIFSQPIAGLAQNTTYYVCAIASNGLGTSVGSVVQFTTAAPPIMTTATASSVTNVAATLNGSGNPNRAATTGWFRYSATDPGACSDSFGIRAPASGGPALGSGAASVPYSQGITGLAAGTTYYFCAVGSNGEGTTFGAVLSFTTPAAPAVSTNAATTVTSTSATFNGLVNPNGAATTSWFRYHTTNPGTCNDTFGVATTTGSNGSGTTTLAIARVITGLTPTTTYYVCAIANNAYGTSVGNVISFTTPAGAPSVTTNAVTAITGTTATVNGTANPNGDATTGWFRYATATPGTCNDSFGTRAPAAGGTALGAGLTNQAFSQGLTGLTPGITYYVCAIASNGVGTSVGSVVAFIPSASPIVTTTAAILVTSTTATLTGSANPQGATTTGWFRYSTTNPVTCNDSFGTRAPPSGSIGLGAGIATVNYSQTVSLLVPGQTYYFCAIASNSAGTGVGAVQQLTALAGIPSVTTVAPTGITTTTATLNGSANPNGAATNAWFRLDTTNPVTCNDTFGTRVPGTAGAALGAGNSAVAYSEALTTLSPGTTYYYCAIAANSAGTGFGTVRTFATPAPPTVATFAATPVTATTATLNAGGNPNGFATTAWFRYSATDPGVCSDSFGTRAPVTGGAGLGSGTAVVAFSQALIGLTPATTYYFCGIAQSSIGLTLGEVLAFTTPPTQPSVTTLPPSAVDVTSATLEGSANPNGAATTAWFRYSTINPGTCNDAFGTRTPPSGGANLGAGNSPVTFSQPLSGLGVGTTYYYCALASNGIGTSSGAMSQFTTASAPTVTTAAATAVGPSSATLNGSAIPNFGATTGWFRYATTNPGTCDDSFGNRAPMTGGTSLGAGSGAVAYTQALTGLSPGTTYFYCAIASNLVGTRFGAVLSFATSSVPAVTTDAVTAITATTATVNGSANPNGTAGTGWFRYATVDPGTCNDSFGTRSPASGGTALGAGTAAVAYNRPLTGLVASTTYFVCAIASNSVGTGFGTVVTFTTAGPPIVTTEPATGVTTTAANLNGTANPNQLASTGWFRYSTASPGTCNDSFGTRAPVSGGTALGAGTAPVPYTQAVSALTPGTTYFYCAIASSSQGTRFGAVMSFSTPAAPTVVTSAATALTSTTATLNGSGDPNGSLATGWFRFATTSPGTCNDSFGTRAPGSGGTDLGAGTVAVTYNEPLTGLTPGTTYFFCAIAANLTGTGFGSVLSFTTPDGPTVTTTAATAVGASTATLNGSANPRGAATTGYYRYSLTDPGTCDDSFGTRAPATGGVSLGAGQAAVGYSQALTGLTSGTAYFYCAIANNVVGTRFGAVLTFTTTAAPTVITEAATAVTSTTATLNASADPNGTAATGWFRYATVSPGTCNDSFGTRSPATGGTALGAGTAPVPYTRAIAALTAGTTYYYCALASNTVGTGLGAVMSFTTPGAPTVTTAAATAVASTTATLNGTASPNGAPTTAWFRYATASPGTCNDTFGTRAPASGGTDVGTGSAAVPYSQGLTGLAPGVTYFVCAIASNASGTRFGTVVSFTTTAAPLVTTVAASGVTSTGATLNGSANPNGTAATAWFRYDTVSPGTCDDSFGTRAPTSGGTALGSGTAAVAYNTALTGLTPATTYYVCAIASNPAGTAFGAVLSFSTPAAPTVTTTSVTALTSTGATLSGLANPNSATATGWFRYSATDPGACDDAFGTRAPTSGGSALGAGTAAVTYTQAILGLTAGTTYYYCAIASNSVGTRFGLVLSFTTAAAPTVTSDPATAVTATGATLNGTGNPNRSTATGYFRYASTDPGTCDDSFGTRTPATGGTDLGVGSSAVPFAQAVSGLAPATSYYYCAIATNAAGTGFGAVRALVTATAAPTVTTNAPSDVMIDSAALNGSVIANGEAATGWFRYGTVDPGSCSDSFGTRVPATGGQAVGAGVVAVAYAEAITGLTTGATYYACAIASNASGTSFGQVVTFEPGAEPPLVTTEAATGVAARDATLAGTANPNGLVAVGWFRYGATDPGTCDDSFGMRAPATDLALGSGTTAAPFSTPLTALLPNATYFYCAAASNVGGASFGAVASFTTAAAPPTVSTVSAAPDQDGAIELSGAGNPEGTASVGWFRYASTDPGTCDDSFGTRTVGDQDLGAGRMAMRFTTAVTLDPGTYYLCAIARNAAGTSVGEVLTFQVTGDGGGGGDGGCCRVGGEAPSPWPALVPFAAAFLLLRRRRRAQQAR